MDQPVLDKMLHLGLFVAAACFVGVVAVAALERLAGSGKPFMRLAHIAIAAAAVAALAVAERLYHAVT